MRSILGLMVIIMIIQQSQQEDTVSCPSGFSLTADKSMCLLAIQNYVTVQSDALVLECQSRHPNAVLATFSNQQEMDQIKSWLDAESHGAKLFWTGFRRYSSGGAGPWKDSYRKPTNVYWNGQQHNSGQHCACLERKNGQWKMDTTMCNTCIYVYGSRKPNPLCMIKTDYCKGNICSERQECIPDPNKKCETAPCLLYRCEAVVSPCEVKTEKPNGCLCEPGLDNCGDTNHCKPFSSSVGYCVTSGFDDDCTQNKQCGDAFFCDIDDSNECGCHIKDNTGSDLQCCSGFSRSGTCIDAPSCTVDFNCFLNDNGDSCIGGVCQGPRKPSTGPQSS